MATDFDYALQHLQSDEPLQTRLLFGLSLITQHNLKQFQAAWPDIPTERRRRIMAELGELTEHNFEVHFAPIFILGLSDPDPEVQTYAIEGLWESESPGLVPPLIHLLQTGELIRLRATAAQALGRFVYLGEIEEVDETVSSVVAQALLQTIRKPDEDIEVVRRAIEAIAFSGQEGIPEIIEYAYYHDDERMQVSAVFAMGRTSDAKRWGEIVLQELDSTDPAIRFEASRAVGELALSAAVPKLIALIENDPDSEVQQNAIWSLGQIGGDEAREVLEMLIDSAEEDLQAAAEEALDELILFSDNPEDVFSYMMDMEDDEDNIHIVDLDDKGQQNGHSAH